MLRRRDFATSRLPYDAIGEPVVAAPRSRRRRSERSVSAMPLGSDDRDVLLSSLVADADEVPPYPSAGALYPGHPFLVEPSATSGRASASYVDGAARRVRPVRELESDGLSQAVFEPWAWPVGCLLVLAVDFRRARTVYGDRGLRFALIETGEMSERWCRAADSVGVGTCAVGGFHDVRLTQILGLDPRFFGAALVIATGYPAAP